MISTKFYKACELNDTDGKLTGIFHFCCIDGHGTSRQVVYPVAYCRKNKCKHISAQEANDCYRKYELDNEVYFFEEDKGAMEQCKMCGMFTKGKCVIGLQEITYFMCPSHWAINGKESTEEEKEIRKKTMDFIETIYPHYKVVD